MITLKDKFSYFMEGTNGKGVLLIHGLTGIPAEMKFVSRLLHRAGYSVYAPLLAGHGIDKETLMKTRWQDWLESVLQAAQELHKEVQSVYTAGICVGGKLGMMAAQRLPHIIKATAIYSPCFNYDGWDVPFYYPLLSRNIGWLAYIPFLNRLSFQETDSIGIKDERLRKFMEGAEAEGVLEEFPARSLVEMYRLGKTLKKQLPHIKTPALILHAEEDDLSNPRNAMTIANAIGGAHTLHWIKDSYHMIHVDRQHKQVAKLTADFFGEQHV
jgi:carboxylesterase